MTTSEKPYNVFTDPLVAVDNGGPLDAVEAWEEAMDDHADYDGSHREEAGIRLAKHATSLREWLHRYEQENAELRALVERVDALRNEPEHERYAGWIQRHRQARELLNTERGLGADTEGEQ